ncbi:hypothetical protein [Tautonia marina]|uniref:hypothetical protein n=1 Tax=Tautonia marina TaxID=2653855 RepID=UPI001260D869|nr:hypothetical protein [Tautonia marina]
MASPNPPRPDQAEVEELRREMARIRREIHADVNVAAEHLEATLNWRGYVRSAPWPAAGAAFGVGFLAAWLLVPRRRIKVIERERATSARRAPRYEEPEQEKGPSKGVVSMALGFLAPIALRAAQNYAIQFVEDRLLAPSAGMGPTPEEEARRVQPDHPTPGRPF